MNKIKRKRDKKHFGWKFNRINPDEKDFDIFVGLCKIHNHIKESLSAVLVV